MNVTATLHEDDVVLVTFEDEPLAVAHGDSFSMKNLDVPDDSPIATWEVPVERGHVAFWQTGTFPSALAKQVLNGKPVMAMATATIDVPVNVIPNPSTEPAPVPVVQQKEAERVITVTTDSGLYTSTGEDPEVVRQLGEAFVWDDATYRSAQGGTTPYMTVLEHAHRNGMNVLLQGKPGTGKTMLAYAYAHKKGLPIFVVEGSEAIDVEELFGKWVPSPDGGFEFAKGAFHFIAEHNGVLVIDEQNCLPEGIQKRFHSILDARRSTKGNDGKNIVLNGCLIIATRNPSTHIGTFLVDSATNRRFAIKDMEIDYNPKVEERLGITGTLAKLAKAVRSTEGLPMPDDREAGKTLMITTPLDTETLVNFIHNTKLSVEFAIANLVEHFDDRPQEKSAVARLIHLEYESELEEQFG